MDQATQKSVEHLTSSRTLARSVFWNILGQMAQLITALVVLPWLVRGLGPERFGLLALAWVVIGYFGVIDLGVGRALTKLVAEKLHVASESELSVLFGTSLGLLLCVGVVGSIAGFLTSQFMVGRILRMSVNLRSEALYSFWLLCLSIPIITVTTGLRGILEAHQRFGILNAIRIPLSVFNFVAPLALLPFSTRLVPIVSLLLLGRGVALLAHWVACRRIAPAARSLQFGRTFIRPLLQLGGWMTISNIISPVMVYVDRFLLGALVSVAAVGYYAVPFEVVTRLLVIPAALVAVLFPALSVATAQEPRRAAMLASRSTVYVILAVFPLALIMATFAYEGLGLWLGPTFALASFRILQLLSAGVLLNCLAQTPFTLIQAAGRPDLTAKLHLLEFPFYLVLACYLIAVYGATGAAIAWVVRVSADAILLFVFSQRVLVSEDLHLSQVAAAGSAAVLAMAAGALLPGVGTKAGLVTVVVATFAIVAWRRVLRPSEKELLTSVFKLVRT